MSKRFIQQVIPDKEFRKLGSSLRQAWYYLWMKCDASGVYEIDEALYHFDTGDEFPIQGLKNHLCEYLEFDKDRILIKSFIQINYGEAKEDYNPHKPLFRAISKNNLKLSPSLNQASFKLDVKLVDEDVDEDEDEDEDVTKGGAGGKSITDTRVVPIDKKDKWYNDEEALQIFEYLNEIGCRSFKPDKKRITAIRQRIKDHGVEMLRKIIELKYYETKHFRKDGEPIFNPKYFRHDTLFRKSNCDNYAEEVRLKEQQISNPTSTTESGGLKEAAAAIQRAGLSRYGSL